MRCMLKYFLLLPLLLGCEAKTIVDPPLPPESVALAAQQFKTGSTNSNWVYFSFAMGDTVKVLAPASVQDWDVAFRRTTIKLNGGTSGPGQGGVIILTNVNFEDIKSVPANAAFAADDSTNNPYAIPTGSGEGWYNYTGEPNHWIVPIDGRVFIFRTAAGQYAKVQFLSYYSNGQPPSEPQQLDSGFYKFKFIYQADGSTSFE